MPAECRLFYRDSPVAMEPLNTLIASVKLTFGLRVDRDIRGLKQVEIVLSLPPEKGTDNTPCLRGNDELAF